jgi:hypothetical protein
VLHPLVTKLAKSWTAGKQLNLRLRKQKQEQGEDATYPALCAPIVQRAFFLLAFEPAFAAPGGGSGGPGTASPSSSAGQL